MTNHEETHVFYNLKVGRNPGEVSSELRAIRDALSPLVLAGSEGNGYVLPHLKGYESIRDRSRPGRANLYAYVNQGVQYKAKWHDLKETWPRAGHPGEHWSRSILEIDIKKGSQVDQVVVSHAPAGTPGTDAAREEWFAAMQKIMSSRLFPNRSRLALTDSNGLGDDLAQALHGELVGDPTNAGVLVRLDGRGVKVDGVGGGAFGRTVYLRSDHEALVVELR